MLCIIQIRINKTIPSKIYYKMLRNKRLFVQKYYNLFYIRMICDGLVLSNNNNFNYYIQLIQIFKDCDYKNQSVLQNQSTMQSLFTRKILVYIDGVYHHREVIEFEMKFQFQKKFDNWLNRFLLKFPYLRFLKMADEGIPPGTSSDTSACYFKRKVPKTAMQAATAVGAGKEERKQAGASKVAPAQSLPPRQHQPPVVNQLEIPAQRVQLQAAQVHPLPLATVPEQLQIEANFSGKDIIDVTNILLDVKEKDALQAKFRAREKALIQQIRFASQQVGGQSWEEWQKSFQRFQDYLDEHLASDQQDLNNQQWSKHIGKNLNQFVFAI